MGNEQKNPLEASIRCCMDSLDSDYAYTVAAALAYDARFLSNARGFRTAGSDAEHAAADYLVQLMTDIGLAEVEKVPVKLDYWQFNGASLTIPGTDINLFPVAYPVNGTSPTGITAEIIDVGCGMADDYAEKDVTGKIVLAGVDFLTSGWDTYIDDYLREASLHGAAMLITHDIGGYAQYSDDMNHVVDLYGQDRIPCMNISNNEYKRIVAAIRAGHCRATAVLDSRMMPDAGIGYNVVGRIKGKSSEHMLVTAAHYDAYFNGFQDDCCGVGAVLALARAYCNAGYTPENDLVFVCHCAEEWGAAGSVFDWATGSYKMITEARPNWAGKILAMFNFELPALNNGFSAYRFYCVPEFSACIRTFVETSGCCPSVAGKCFPAGVVTETDDVITIDDGNAYRTQGVPYFGNPFAGDMATGMPSGWMLQRYHTQKDDCETYDADVMLTNLQMFAALTIYIDQNPALPLDFTATCDALAKSASPAAFALANVDAATYGRAVARFRAAAQAHADRVTRCNAAYREAPSDANGKSAAQRIRKIASAENERALAAFKTVQDAFVGFIGTGVVCNRHEPYADNVQTLSGIIAALAQKQLYTAEKDGALDLAKGLNSGMEAVYYGKRSRVCADEKIATMREETNPGKLYWGTDKGYVFAETADATVSLLERAAKRQSGADASFAWELAQYQTAYVAQCKLLKQTVEKEIQAMEALSDMLGGTREPERP